MCGEAFVADRGNGSLHLAFMWQRYCAPTTERSDGCHAQDLVQSARDKCGGSQRRYQEPVR